MVVAAFDVGLEFRGGRDIVAAIDADIAAKHEPPISSGAEQGEDK
jgi:hypothetical protein